MNADLISLLIADLVVLGMSIVGLLPLVGRAFWPRCSATVVDRTVFSGYDGTLLVRFVPPEGKAVEAVLCNEADDPMFLARHPVGSAVRVCFPPQKPKEACLSAPLLHLAVGCAYLLVINAGFLCGTLRFWQAP